MAYWLMKSEPQVFSLDDLRRARTTSWDGVRNYQARNFMRDGMKRGDEVFFYHSSCDEPAIVGIMAVTGEAKPDATQFDSRSSGYDPASTRAAPRWLAVQVRFVRRLKRPVALERLRAERRLSGLALLRRGNRLSVMPVSKAEWEHILALEGVEKC